MSIVAILEFGGECCRLSEAAFRLGSVLGQGAGRRQHDR